MRKLKIIIVIVNYKTYEDLGKCLRALEVQKNIENYSIDTIIIDSEYQAIEVSKLKKNYSKHEFILQDNSYGVSANYNKGFKKALSLGADYILMVTPDVYLQNNVLGTLVRKMEDVGQLGAVTCKTLLPTDPPRIYFISGSIDSVAFSTKHIGYFEEDKKQYDFLENTDFLNCALVLIRARVFLKVGFWEPKYYLCYEDADWTFRVKKAGYTIAVIKDVFAWHDESSTVGKKSMQQEYYLARNHLLFIKRNAPLKKRLLAYLFIIKDSLKLIPKLFRKREKTRAYHILLGRKDFLLGKFGYKKILMENPAG